MKWCKIYHQVVNFTPLTSWQLDSDSRRNDGPGFREQYVERHCQVEDRKNISNATLSQLITFLDSLSSYTWRRKAIPRPSQPQNPEKFNKAIKKGHIYVSGIRNAEDKKDTRAADLDPFGPTVGGRVTPHFPLDKLERLVDPNDQKMHYKHQHEAFNSGK